MKIAIVYLKYKSEWAKRRAKLLRRAGHKVVWIKSKGKIHGERVTQVFRDEMA